VRAIWRCKSRRASAHAQYGAANRGELSRTRNTPLQIAASLRARAIRRCKSRRAFAHAQYAAANRGELSRTRDAPLQIAARNILFRVSSCYT
jgi:uncharacterized protein YqeY